MSRNWVPTLSYTPGAGTKVHINDFLQPVKDNLDLIALGCFARNLKGGGSELVGMGVGSGTGFQTVFDCLEFEIDNSSNQISGTSSVLVCQVRVSLRVQDVSISVTPQIYNFTDSTVPTQSGAAACSATALDFSGSNQKQTIALTLPTGKKKFIVQVQKSADTFAVWAANVAWDVYING